MMDIAFYSNYATFIHIIQTYNDLQSSRKEVLERCLINNNISHCSKAFAAFLLLLKKLASPCDVARVKLGEHVFAERLDGFPRNDAISGRRLDDNLCTRSA